MDIPVYHNHRRQSTAAKASRPLQAEQPIRGSLTRFDLELMFQQLQNATAAPHVASRPQTDLDCVFAWLGETELRLE
jgi:hypothetical protein